METIRSILNFNPLSWLVDINLELLSCLMAVGKPVTLSLPLPHPIALTSWLQNTLLDRILQTDYFHFRGTGLHVCSFTSAISLIILAIQLVHLEAQLPCSVARLCTCVVLRTSTLNGYTQADWCRYPEGGRNPISRGAKLKFTLLWTSNENDDFPNDSVPRSFLQLIVWR